MTFKLGFLFGFAVGYVLGARAGEERYQKIVEAVRSFRKNPRFEQITDSARSQPPGPILDDTPPYEDQESSVGDKGPQAETARTVET